jgi:hypothetical protein
MGTILPRIMDKQREVATILAESEVNVGPITLDELLLTLKSSNNKRAPVPDEMNIELIKTASLSYILKFLEFLYRCWKTGSILDEWKGAVI